MLLPCNQLVGGGPLRACRKGAHGLACHISARPLTWRPAAAAQVAEEREQRKVAAARLALAGGSFTESEDPFEGLSPRARPAALPWPHVRWGTNLWQVLILRVGGYARLGAAARRAAHAPALSSSLHPCL